MAAAHDPLEALGPDVFHMVVGYLDAEDLIAVELVNRRWNDFVTSQTHLWRSVCRRERVDMLECTDGREPPEEGYDGTACRLAAKLSVPLKKAWKTGNYDNFVVPNFEGTRVAAMVQGPAHNHMSLLIELEDGAFDLVVVDKYSAEVLSHNEDVSFGTMVAGGGYLALASNGTNDVPGFTMRRHLGPVTIYTMPTEETAREYDAQRMKPPMTAGFPTRSLAQCGSMVMHIEPRTGKPVLFGAAPTHIIEIHLAEDVWREERIELSYPDMESLERINKFAVDDEFIVIAGVYQVHVLLRATGETIASIGPTLEHANVPMAALAYKVPTQTVVDVQAALRDADFVNVPDAIAIRLRRLTECGKAESIWQLEEDAGSWDHAGNPLLGIGDDAEDDEEGDQAEAVPAATQGEEVGEPAASQVEQAQDAVEGTASFTAASEQDDQAPAAVEAAAQGDESDEPATTQAEQPQDVLPPTEGNASSSAADGQGGPPDSVQALAEGDEPDEPAAALAEPNHGASSHVANNASSHAVAERGGPSQDSTPAATQEPATPPAPPGQDASSLADGNASSEKARAADDKAFNPGPAPFNFYDLEDLSGASTLEPDWSVVPQYEGVMGVDGVIKTNHLIVRAGDTGFLVVLNYQDVFRKIAQRPSLTAEQRSKMVAAHSVLIGIPWDVQALESPGRVCTAVSCDKMLVIHEYNAGIIVLDTSQFPTLPLARTNEPVPDTPVKAHVYLLPWSASVPSLQHIRLEILVDSRGVYCTDLRDSPERAEDPYHEKWDRMMGQNPGGIKLWSFRPPRKTADESGAEGEKSAKGKQPMLRGETVD